MSCSCWVTLLRALGELVCIMGTSVVVLVIGASLIKGRRK